MRQYAKLIAYCVSIAFLLIYRFFGYEISEDYVPIVVEIVIAVGGGIAVYWARNTASV